MSEFVEYLKELFQEFGPVNARRMFGGHGIFFDGLMIGLVADDRLYLKVDAQSVTKFTERSLPQFQYPKGDKVVGMSYYLRHWKLRPKCGSGRSWPTKRHSGQGGET